jgi:uncharacterized protein YcnI
MSKRRFIISTVTSIVAIAIIPASAFAHVIVTPGQVGIGSELTFNISVPNEQDTPVTNLKLDIPNGVTDVVPTTKDGWTISTTLNGDSKDPEVTSITWSDGNIPVGQRQDFSFSAQVPGSATELDWKAYQTYGDGTIVHWDQKPAGSDDSTGDAGPYSVTHVVNDLTSSSSVTTSSEGSSSLLPLFISIAAVVLSFGSILIRRRK